MKKKILICAGGTGGHIYPAQVVASQLQKRNPNIEILFIGGGLCGNPYFDREKFRYLSITSSTIRGKNPFKLLKSAASIAYGTYCSRKLLTEYQPDLTVGFGSHHSFPVLLAAISKKLPILLHESNSIPGKVIRFISRYAETTAIQFPSCASSIRGNSIVTNMPLREEFNQPMSAQEARTALGLDPELPTILVFGGSQGAKAINEQFLAALPLLNKMRPFQVYHITGKNVLLSDVREQYQKNGIKACVKDFEGHMPLAWRAADCIISRSGAGTIAEQLTCAVPGILIPYPHAADNHQYENARFVEEMGGIKIIQQSELSPVKLAQELETLFDANQERLLFMKKVLENYQRRDQKKDFLDLVLEVLERT